MVVHSVGPWTDNGSLALEPSAGNIFIAFDVSIRNDTDQEFTANSAAFSIRDDSGRQYDRRAIGPEPALPLARLYKGEIARGWTAMQVPANLPAATLVYELNTFTGEDIRFKLW